MRLYTFTQKEKYLSCRKLASKLFSRKYITFKFLLEKDLKVLSPEQSFHVALLAALHTMSFDTKMIVHAYQSISIYPYSKDKVLETNVKYVFSMSFDYVFQERDLQSVIPVVNNSYSL